MKQKTEVRGKGGGDRVDAIKGPLLWKRRISLMQERKKVVGVTERAIRYEGIGGPVREEGLTGCKNTQDARNGPGSRPHMGVGKKGV